mmetsp:Transcript_4024/g.6035  ORF Transcript_4024/g.6035 Transcript_4024/m.6035 type:complete len:117 (+) Transcript_4024:180-530(+)
MRIGIAIVDRLLSLSQFRRGGYGYDGGAMCSDGCQFGWTHTVSCAWEGCGDESSGWAYDWFVRTDDMNENENDMEREREMYALLFGREKEKYKSSFGGDVDTVLVPFRKSLICIST